jgi:hypothetical protein
MRSGRRKRVGGIEEDSGRDVFKSSGKEVFKSSGKEVFKAKGPRRR